MKRSRPTGGDSVAKRSKPGVDGEADDETQAPVEVSEVGEEHGQMLHFIKNARREAFGRWTKLLRAIGKGKRGPAAAPDPSFPPAPGPESHYTAFDVEGYTWLTYVVAREDDSDDQSARAIAALGKIFPKALQTAAVARDRHQQSAMFFAARQNKLRCVKLIASAAQRGGKSAADLLQETDALWGQTALFYAAHRGCLRVVQWIVWVLGSAERWDIVDKEGDTPLMYAVKGQNVEVLKFMLAEGGRVLNVNNRRMNTLDLARKLTKKPMQTQLIRAVENCCEAVSFETLMSGYARNYVKAATARRSTALASSLLVKSADGLRIPESIQASTIAKQLGVTEEQVLPGFEDIKVAESSLKLEQYSEERCFAWDQFRAAWGSLFARKLDRISPGDAGSMGAVLRQTEIGSRLRNRIEMSRYRTPQNFLHDLNCMSLQEIADKTIRDAFLQTIFQRLLLDLEEPKLAAELMPRGVGFLLDDMRHQRAVHGRIVRPLVKQVKELVLRYD